MENSYAGIDNGRGLVNIDKETGIRYGVMQATTDLATIFAWEGEFINPDPACPYCGNHVFDMSSANRINEKIELADSSHCIEFYCPACRHFLDSEDCTGDAIGQEIDKNGVHAVFYFESNEVWVYKSTHFVYGSYCSPCAPGAIDLDNSVDHGTLSNAGYCIPSEWFETEPYNSYLVAGSFGSDE